MLGATILGCGETTHSVTVDVGQTHPRVVAYRDGDARWKVVSSASGHRYSFDVENDFVVIVVCQNDDMSFDAEELKATASDGTDWLLLPTMAGLSGGCANSSPSGTVYAVDGTISDPAWISMGASMAGSAVGPWDFHLLVPAGVRDLVVTEGLVADISNPRLVIRHANQVMSDTVLPAVDLQTEGLPLSRVPLAVSGVAPGATVSTSVTMCKNDLAYISKTDGQVAYVAPSDVLSEDDVQCIDILALSGFKAQGARAQFRSIPSTTYSLLPPADVSYARVGTELIAPVSRDFLGTDGSAQLSITDRTSRSVQHVSVTAGWLNAQGKNELAFELSDSAPLNTWALPLTNLDVQFSLERTIGMVSYWSSQFDEL